MYKTISMGITIGIIAATLIAVVNSDASASTKEYCPQQKETRDQCAGASSDKASCKDQIAGLPNSEIKCKEQSKAAP